MSEQYLLEMKGICKSFPGVKALQNVDLQLKAGEVHALLGENGAGKSTLIKVLGGIYHAEEGEIIIDGQKVKLTASWQPAMLVFPLCTRSWCWFPI